MTKADSNKTRIHSIDALRGFALFGILIVNIFSFHAPYPYVGDFYFSMDGMELSIVQEVLSFWFGGKFMFIFAFLFGYGCWLQYERMADHVKFTTYWIRRMLILALFGIFHIVFLSYGDILLAYAILGLSLPLFIRLGKTVVISAAILLYLIPVADFMWRLATEGTFPAMTASYSLEEYISIYGNGNFIELINIRIKDFFGFLTTEKPIMYIPKELALFLVGLLAGQSKLATQSDRKSELWFCLFAGLNIIAWYFLQEKIYAAFELSKSSHALILGLLVQTKEFLHGMFYIIVFWLLYQTNFFRKVLSVFRYPGKMSLTNYIMQSFICLIIFNGIGFGYYGKLLPSQLMIIAVSIFIFQMIFSYLWLQRGKFGPLEALWRKLAGRKA